MEAKRVRRILVLALCAALMTMGATAVSGAPGPKYFVDESTLPFDPLPGHSDSDRMWGVRNGAGYRIEVPVDWNGELVMWAHGFRGSDQRLHFQGDEVPIRQWLLDNGFAWAASTYSSNDYNVADGVKDTHALATYFNGSVGNPTRTYIAGVSMGGHITAVSIEQYPNFYDAALPACGVLADYELFDYFLDFNLAAQQIALGESTFPVEDPVTYLTQTSGTIKAQLSSIPGGWPLFLNADGAALKQLTENISGGDRPNFDEAWFFWNSFPEFGSNIPGNFLFDLGVGDGTLAGQPGNALDNTDRLYEIDLIPGISNEAEAALNEGIFRVAADPQARHRAGLSNVPPVAGDPTVPVLTMHNLGDLFVPFGMEVSYGHRAAANGKSDLVVQRAIRGVGHCDFTDAEWNQAIADLVSWVETGVRPSGDDVTNPAAVADPTFGCAFTDPSGFHFLATPCP